MKIWIEHLKGITAAAEAFEEFRRAFENLPGDSELSGEASFEFSIGGYLPGWFIVREDDATYVQFRDEDDDDE